VPAPKEAGRLIWVQLTSIQEQPVRVMAMKVCYLAIAAVRVSLTMQSTKQNPTSASRKSELALSTVISTDGRMGKNRVRK